MLLAAVLAISAMAMPAIIEALNAMKFAQEAQNAKNLALLLKASSEKSTAFEEKSSETIEGRTELPWTLRASGNSIEVTVESRQLEKEKTVKETASAEFYSFEEKLEGKFSLKVKKENGKALIVNE